MPSVKKIQHGGFCFAWPAIPSAIIGQLDLHRRVLCNSKCLGISLEQIRDVLGLDQLFEVVKRATECMQA